MYTYIIYSEKTGVFGARRWYTIESDEKMTRLPESWKRKSGVHAEEACWSVRTTSYALDDTVVIAAGGRYLGITDLHLSAVPGDRSPGIVEFRPEAWWAEFLPA